MGATVLLNNVGKLAPPPKFVWQGQVRRQAGLMRNVLLILCLSGGKKQKKEDNRPPSTSNHGLSYKGYGFLQPHLQDPPRKQLRNVRTSVIEDDLASRRCTNRSCSILYPPPYLENSCLSATLSRSSVTPVPHCDSSPVKGDIFAQDFATARYRLLDQGYTTDIIQK